MAQGTRTTAAGGPTCILPGCTEPVAEQGAACQSCIDDWGPHLRAGDGPTMTVEDQQARDRATQKAYAMQLAGDDPEKVAAVHAHYTESTTTIRRREEPVGKANQRCWLCEERRTCTQEVNGWECKTCRQDVV